MTDFPRYSNNPAQLLSGELSLLTDQDGPLYRLVEEVKKSNLKADRNIRLQRWSLVVLCLSLLGLGFMAFVVLGTVGVFFDTRTTLQAVVEQSEAALKMAQQQQASQPEVVVDKDTGKVSLIANLRTDDVVVDAVEQPEPEPEPVVAKDPSSEKVVAGLLGKKIRSAAKPKMSSAPPSRARAAVEIDSVEFRQ